MTLERKKNNTPRRQARAYHNNNNNNNNNTTSSSNTTVSANLSAGASSPASYDGPVNNNVSCGDGIKSGKCNLSSADDDDNDSAREPINSRNTPSSINILTSSTGSSVDHFANR